MIFGRDIGIDLGTATVLVSVKGKASSRGEPSVVAMDKNTGRLFKGRHGGPAYAGQNARKHSGD